MVVGFHVEAAEPDGEQSGAAGIGVEFAVDVGGVDDLGEPCQGEITGETEVVDEDFEGAFAGAVIELGAGCVEGTRAVAGGDVEDRG